MDGFCCYAWTRDTTIRLYSWKNLKVVHVTSDPNFQLSVLWDDQWSGWGLDPYAVQFWFFLCSIHHFLWRLQRHDPGSQLLSESQFWCETARLLWRLNVRERMWRQNHMQIVWATTGSNVHQGWLTEIFLSKVNDQSSHEWNVPKDNISNFQMPNK